MYLNSIHPLVLQTAAVIIAGRTIAFADDGLVQLVGVVTQLLSLLLTVQFPRLLLLQS
jgi:hypothetical protein